MWFVLVIFIVLGWNWPNCVIFNFYKWCFIKLNVNIVRYSPRFLKAIRPAIVNTPQLQYDIPCDIKPRKRGRRGGVRARTRRRHTKPFLPIIVSGNARSLNNKLDELTANCRYLYQYREASLICISESWFSEETDSSSINIPNFELFRNDRTEDSGKKSGGGVCVFVNSNWCSKNNVIF